MMKKCVFSSFIASTWANMLAKCVYWWKMYSIFFSTDEIETEMKWKNHIKFIDTTQMHVCEYVCKHSLFTSLLLRKSKPVFLLRYLLCSLLFHSYRSNGNFPNYFLLSQWNCILFIITQTHDKHGAHQIGRGRRKWHSLAMYIWHRGWMSIGKFHSFNIHANDWFIHSVFQSMIDNHIHCLCYYLPKILGQLVDQLAKITILKTAVPNSHHCIENWINQIR